MPPAKSLIDKAAAEEALRQSELWTKQVLDNIPECIFVLDVTFDGRFKFAALNPAGEKAVGLSTADVCGRFIEDVFSDEVSENLIAHYRRCLEVRSSATRMNSIWMSDAGIFTRTSFRCEMLPVAFTTLPDVVLILRK